MWLFPPPDDQLNHRHDEHHTYIVAMFGSRAFSFFSSYFPPQRPSRVSSDRPRGRMTNLTALVGHHGRGEGSMVHALRGT